MTKRRIILMIRRRATERGCAGALESNRPDARACGKPRSSEAGYAYFMALALIVAMIIASQIVMENLVTQGRRQREETTIWRGNQWARAIRLYYHKTGRYPQSIDDLQTGLPDHHFLRAVAIKDPMDTNGGSWRFIYVNATGQIIGSVRYATLQQMAILDLNNGQIPGAQASGIPGAVTAASLSSTFSSSTNATTPDNSSPGPDGASTASPGGPGSSDQGNTTSVGGTNGQSPQGNGAPGEFSQTSSNPAGNSTGQDTSQNSNSGQTSAFGQGQSASAFGSSGSSPFGSGASGPAANPLAALAQLQPTGPVDGPVIGAFLTGVGIPVAIDQSSIKVYHGAKKYKDWEFIWNPLEDQAQALQQGLGATGQGGAPPPPGTGSSSSSGASPFGNSFSLGSSSSPGSQSPMQQQPVQQAPPQQ
jgi:uncharacterized membrane protein YgcG